MPEGVQLKRTRGWRMPPNTVKVCRPGKWGNKFRIGDTVQRFSAERICETVHVKDAATAVALHREFLELAIQQHPEIVLPELEELRGKNLACWCGLDMPCHRNTLLELANAPRERSKEHGDRGAESTERTRLWQRERANG